MRVIVTSSRTWPEGMLGSEIVYNTLEGLRLLNGYTGEPLTIVHGACPTGGDHLASLWCAQMRRMREDIFEGVTLLPGTEVIEEKHPAAWDKYGRGAGPKRNAEMTGRGADLCLAFLYEPPGIKSTGTRGTMREAEFHGIKVVTIPWPTEPV